MLGLQNCVSYRIFMCLLSVANSGNSDFGTARLEASLKGQPHEHHGFEIVSVQEARDERFLTRNVGTLLWFGVISKAGFG
jgi:hypothetical protein